MRSAEAGAQALSAYREGRIDDAERLCRDAVADDPGNFDAHHLLAVIAAGRGELADALAGYDRALAIRPDDPQVLSNRAVALSAAGEHELALASCDRALAARSDFAPALSNRGNALRALKRFHEALASYDQALALWPQFPEALSNRGTALHSLERYVEALDSYDRALALRPGYAHALSNRGLSLQQLGRLNEAMQSYDRALQAQPQFVDAHSNRALLLLLRGEFRDGWQEYEWRRRAPSWEQRDFAAPEWGGEALNGRRLLLYAEQGLGDTIQFARFAPFLAARGGDVILEVPPRLGALLNTLPGLCRIMRRGEQLPQIDCQAPLMSVPRALGLDVADIPAAVPYLYADPDRIAAWRARLPADGFRIGIALQGKPQGDADRGRSIPLAMFARLGRLPDVRLVCLQKNHGIEQLANLPAGMNVLDLGPDFDAGDDGFLDAAAVIAQLDLVITGDSTIAHLAGALGRPVWIVLGAVPDWRWLLDRADSPWYPTARLFRQRRQGDWDEVMTRVAAALTAMAGSHTESPVATATIVSSTDAAISGYVITLARRTDRRERFLRWNAGKGVDFHMFDAVDGRALRKQDLIEQGIVADESLGFSSGALGNALSHRRLWETCLELDRPIMIFEDDAFIPTAIADWIERIAAEVESHCEIFYAGYNRDAILSIGYGGQWCNIAFEAPPMPFDALITQPGFAHAEGFRTIVDTRLAWGSLGYAIAPRGAQLLLRHCFPLSDKLPVRMFGSGRLLKPYALDGIINVVVQRGLVRARTVFPPLIIGPNEPGDSDVVRHLQQAPQA